jgi:parallel beta-helix repeat protein
MNKGFLISSCIAIILLNTTISAAILPRLKTEGVSIIGNTLHVGGSGSGNYTTIQSAVDNASDGDTVFVYDDSSPYYENIVIAKTIDLVGEDRNSTIINGGGNNDTVHVSADSVTIGGFTIKNGYYNGIVVRSSSNIISGNIITKAIDSGINVLESGNNNTISCNILFNNGWCGIYVDSSGNTISGNTVKTNKEGGIYLRSSGNTVVNNVFFNNGIFMDHNYNAYPNTVLNNTINGKPLVYLEEESSKVIDGDAGQIILVFCDNITVKSLEVSNVLAGVQVLESGNCKICGNNIHSTRRYGIVLYNSNGINISKNNISSNNYIGIFLEKSSYNTISGNIISNNYDGIFQRGKCLKPGEIYSSRNNIISGNVISSSKRSNIAILLSANTSIIRNHIAHCKDFTFSTGLRLSSSYFTKIIENNFIGNIVDAEFDMAYLSQWYSNYWGRPRLLPKPIYGYLWWIGQIPIFCVNFDWHPALKPYDIS